MLKISNKLIVLFLFFLVVSACSSGDSSGPTLVEVSSDEESVDFEEENDDEEEDSDEEEADNEVAEFIPPELPDLPDPEISSSKWNQVNGPFGGTVTSLFKTVDGYWATTTDNSGFADSNLYFIDKETFTWELKKTIGGNMAGVVVGKHNPDGVAFITEASNTSDSKLFISLDKGLTWTETNPVGNFEPGVVEYTGIAIDKTMDFLYVAGRYLPFGEDCEDDENGDCSPIENSAVYISPDWGDQWTRTNPVPKGVFEEIELEEGQELDEEEIDRIETVYVDPQNPSIIFVGTDNLVAKTEDSGETWKIVSESFHRSDVNGIAIHPENSDVVYVRVGKYTFADCFNLEDEDPDYEEDVARYCAGIYRSVDGGSSWVLLDGVSGDPSEGGVYVDDFNENVVYSVFSRVTFISKDGGNSSEEFLSTSEHPIIPDVGVEIIMTGENSTEVIMAGLQGVYRTYDEGSSWIETNTGFVGSEVVDIATATDGTMYATTYNIGIFKSIDNGKNWGFASFGIKNWYGMQLAPHPIDPDIVFATFGGGVYKSENAGGSWEIIGGADLCDDPEPGGGNCHYHGIIVETESPYKVLVGSGGDQSAKRGVGITGSENLGESWRNSDDGFTRDVHVSKLVIDPNNSDVFYATTQGQTDYTDKIGDGAGVFKSVDRGSSWEQINNGLNTLETNVLVVDPNDSNTLYLGTDDDGLYKSTNGGANWTQLNVPQISEPFGVGDIAVDPKDSNMLYLATVDYFRLAGDRGALGDFGVYKSTDGGTTWEDFNKGLLHPGVFSLELNPETRILYAGTRAGGVYWISLDD